MTDTDFIASPPAVFLKLPDHAGQHFLLHPACGDLFFSCNIIMPARGLILLLILLLSLSCLSNLVCGISMYAMHSCLKTALAVMFYLFLVNQMMRP